MMLAVFALWQKEIWFLLVEGHEYFPPGVTSIPQTMSIPSGPLLDGYAERNFWSIQVRPVTRAAASETIVLGQRRRFTWRVSGNYWWLPDTAHSLQYGGPVTVNRDF